MPNRSITVVVTFFLLAAIILCLPGGSHAAAQGRSAASPKILELPVTSDLAQFFFKKDGTFEFFVLPEYAAQAVAFNEQECSVRLQGGLVDYVKSDWCYYEIGRFYSDGFWYSLIIYNYPGEFEDPYLAVQLNGYAADGRLLDAVVLDTRYSFEDVEGFSEYEIESRTVTVKNYVGYYWDADDLEAGMVHEPPHQLYRELQYKIQKGHFRKTAEEKHPVYFINNDRQD